MKKIILLILILIWSLLFFVFNAESATIYVDNTTTDCATPTDNDYEPDDDTCGAGGADTVYDHPQGAEDNANAGDTIIIADGTYNTDGDSDDIILHIETTGGAGNWITYKGETPCTTSGGTTTCGAVLNGNSNAIDYGVIADTNADYISIEDLEITGFAWGGVKLNGENLKVYRNYIHAIADGMCVDNCGRNCVFISASATTALLDSNVIANCGRDTVGCNYCQTHDHGIYAYGDDWDVYNNIFYDNITGYDIQFAGCDDVNIVNNTFDDGNIQQIVLWNNNDNVLIQNNLFFDPSSAAIKCSSGSHTNITVKYNLTDNDDMFYGCGDDNITEAYNQTLITELQFGFTDVSSRDYTIKSNSIAVDAGYTPNAPALDYNGETRDSFVDIGADEYVFPFTPPTGKIINDGDTWKYFKGTEHPGALWDTAGFDDSGWSSGATCIGYGDCAETVLDDMKNSYWSFYARKTFTVTDASLVTTLTLWVDWDDGYVANINGVEVQRSHMPGGEPDFDTAANSGHESGSFIEYDLAANISDLGDGTNVLAIEVHNQTLNSSDAVLTAELEVIAAGLPPSDHPYYCDNDSDTYEDASVSGACSGEGCEPAGCLTVQGDDCDDTNANINIAASDNNCDGIERSNNLC
jgi:hypothetical protein